MNDYEALIDANIAALSKTIEMSKRGKTLKAEFVRDDGGGGKYYGYMRGGKVHVIHARQYARGRYGGSSPYSQQLGAGDEGSTMEADAKPSAPDASSESAVDYGGKMVNAWHEDADKILGGIDQPGAEGGAGASQGQAKKEVGAVGAAGGGSFKPAIQPMINPGANDITKDETKLENIVARLAEAYAQYLKIKGGKDYRNAFELAMDAVQGLFKVQVLQRIRKLTGHDIIYDITQNQFRYAKGKGASTGLSPRDQSIVDSVVAEFTDKSNKAIKAKQTAVRRAEGSNE